MKNRISLLISALLLCSCGNTDVSETAPVDTQPQIIAVSDSGYHIDYPENVSSGQKDKIDINDIYISEEKEQTLIVIDYKFKQCWFSEPSSFADTYSDSVYINGIETDHYYGDISDAEAQYNTNILSLTYANVKVGYKLKDYDSAKDKEFRLILNLRQSGLSIYEISGKIGDLKRND